MKPAISTKIDRDLLEVVDEICDRKKITRSDFLLKAIKHYLASSSLNGISSLDQPDEEMKAYISEKEKQFEKEILLRERRS